MVGWLLTPWGVVGLALNHSQRPERIELRSGLVPSVGDMFPEMCSVGDKSDNLDSFEFLKEKLGPVWGQEFFRGQEICGCDFCLGDTHFFREAEALVITYTPLKTEISNKMMVGSRFKWNFLFKMVPFWETCSLSGCIYTYIYIHIYLGNLSLRPFWVGFPY